MQNRWLGRLESRPWAPRALAVISCALALLAAQPALNAQAGTSPQVPLVAPDHSPAAAAAVPARRDFRPAALTAARRETTFFSSARRLHILATVEILKRLILSELQPATQHFIVPVLALEPREYLQSLPVILACGNGQAPPPPYAPLPPPERRFLLEKFQLAPPIV